MKLHDWICCQCGWVNSPLRTRCRNFECSAPRAAFHPDPDIDDACWRQWQVDTDFNLSVGLPAESVPGAGEEGLP